MSTFWTMPGMGKPVRLYTSSTARRKERREMRKHARRMELSGCPERAETWRRRARNG